MVTKLIIRIADKLKPLLVKMIPKKLLSRAKQRAFLGAFKEMESYQVLPYDGEKFAGGVNLIGNIREETGLGQSCRLVANLLTQECANCPFSTLSCQCHKQKR